MVEFEVIEVDVVRNVTNISGVVERRARQCREGAPGQGTPHQQGADNSLATTHMILAPGGGIKLDCAVALGEPGRSRHFSVQGLIRLRDTEVPHRPQTNRTDSRDATE